MSKPKAAHIPPLLPAVVLAALACTRPSTPAVVPMELPSARPAVETPPVGSSLPDPPRERFRAGDAVEVEWHGDWWPAHVTAVEPGPRYTVSYDDYGEEWDETIEPSRIRQPLPQP